MAQSHHTKCIGSFWDVYVMMYITWEACHNKVSIIMDPRRSGCKPRCHHSLWRGHNSLLSFEDTTQEPTSLSISPPTLHQQDPNPSISANVSDHISDPSPEKKIHTTPSTSAHLPHILLHLYRFTMPEPLCMSLVSRLARNGSFDKCSW